LIEFELEFEQVAGRRTQAGAAAVCTRTSLAEFEGQLDQSMKSLGEKFCGVDRFILQSSMVFGGSERRQTTPICRVLDCKIRRFERSSPPDCGTNLLTPPNVAERISARPSSPAARQNSLIQQSAVCREPRISPGASLPALQEKFGRCRTISSNQTFAGLLPQPDQTYQEPRIKNG
jgi:hypothetical protein